MAASSPVNCFDYAFYAAKVAIEHMTPVILLSDGFLANGTQPWRIPEEGEFPNIVPPFVEKPASDWQVYERDPERLNRYWALPGTPDYQHRIGGLEKDYLNGSVSYDHHNHDKMVRIRQEKIDRIAEFIPPLEIHGDENADLLIVGWGGTFGHLYTALEELQEEGEKVAQVHFSYINPLPKNTREVLKKYAKIVVCELNLGQFASFLRSKFPDVQFNQYNKVEGLPFTVAELKKYFKKLLEE
jgi:2-oxoglutarate ferredoxin oxidoreductase subunit alpha